MSLTYSPNANGRFPAADGALPYRSENLALIQQHLRNGRSVCVVGPHHRAKSKLMHATINQLVKEHVTTAYFSLSHIRSTSHNTYFSSLSSDMLLVNEQDFYAGLYSGLESSIAHLPPVKSRQKPISRPTFFHAITALVDACPNDLVLFIDDVGMAPPNLVDGMLSALRQAYLHVQKRLGAKLRVVICGVLDISNPTEYIGRFLEIAEPVWVEDLAPEEGQALAIHLCQTIGIHPTLDGINALLKQAGGNYLLIHELCKISFEQMKVESKQVLSPARVDEAVTTFLERPSDPLQEDILRPIESDPELLRCTLFILHNGQLPLQHLPADYAATHNPLDLCGIFERENGAYSIKGNLWRRLLEQHLSHATAGTLYAVAGAWEAAIVQFGKAIAQGQQDVRAELFSVILNAMHQCADHLQAFNFLGKGLLALFPNNDVRLYFRSNRHLRPVFPKPKGENGTVRLALEEQPEVTALYGPAYTVTRLKDKTHLLIPMRMNNQPTGLASFTHLATGRSPYQSRRLLLQLIHFLQQATEVASQRRDYANRLRMENRRANQLEALNTALTAMLPHRHQSEAMIIDAALTSITATYGLGLQRAVLFMPDEAGQTLVGIAGKERTKQPSAKSVTTTAAKSFQRMVRGLASQLDAPAERNVLAEVFHSRQARRSRRMEQVTTLPANLQRKLNAPPEFAVLPLNSGAEVLGVLYVDNKRSRIHSEQYQLLQSFINQVALVMANGRALRAEQTRAQQLRQLATLEERINGRISESVPALLNEIVTAARQLLGADSAILYPCENKAGEPCNLEVAHLASVGLRPIPAIATSLAPPRQIASRILLHQTICINNIPKETAHPRRRQSVADSFVTHQKIGAFLGLRLGVEEMPLGVLFINWRQPRRLSKEEIMLANMLVKFVSVAIPSAQRYQQVQLDLKRRRQEMNELGNVFKTVYESGRYERQIAVAIRASLKIAQRVINASYICVVRAEPQQQWYTYTLTPAGKLHAKIKTEPPQGLPRAIFETQRPMLLHHADQSLSYTYLPETKSALAVPVKGRNQIQAVVYVENPEAEGLTADNQEFLQSIANRLSLAMEQDERNQALYQLLQGVFEVTTETNLRTVLGRLVQQTMLAMPAVDAVALYYFERSTGALMVSYISAGQTAAKINQSAFPSAKFVGWLLSHEDALFLDDSSLPPIIREAFPQREIVKSAAAIPLLRHGHEWAGCMFFGYQQQHHFGEGERNLMELFAQLAALGILRVTLYEEAESRLQRLDTVGRITPIISSNFELDEVVHTVLDEVIKVLPKANHGCILLKQPNGQLLHMAGNKRRFYPYDLETAVFQEHQISQTRRGIFHRVFRSGKSVVIPDVQQDPDYIPIIDTTRSKLCVPIKIGPEVGAVLVLESDQSNAFTADDQRLLEMLAEYITIAIQNVDRLNQARALELSQRTAQMAAGFIHDINNTISNIPGLVSEIQRKVAQEQPIADPLADLQTSAKSTERISKRLHDFVVTEEYKPTRCNLVEIVEIALTGSKVQQPQHVQVQFEPPEEPLPMMLDGVWVELLLKNLLINAFAAISEERVGQVVVTLERGKTAVFIQISDNGRGIAETLHPTIFDFGVTTKKGKRLTGIGLYHCRQIVNTHGGELTFTSTVGKGTTFTIELPNSLLTKKAQPEE